MANPTTIVIQIDKFCNCEGCIKKVKKALRKLDDVTLLTMDPDIGKFTIKTTKHPQVIEHALKQPFPKRNITMSHPHVDNIATTLVIMPQGQGLESMEYTQSSTFKFNFTNRHLPSFNNVHAPTPPPVPPPPRANIRPSAPPIPTTPDVVYGYPQEYFGFKDHPHDC